MTLTDFNLLTANEIIPLLSQCCGSSNWATRMAENRPFESFSKMVENSNRVWYSLDREDWLQAFEQHPQIGDLSTLRKKFSSTASLAASEQSAASSGNDQILEELAEYNRRYFEKFGYLFIICATGKSADEMLSSLKVRISNDGNTEIQSAAAEQIKITNLRLKKLIK